MGMEGFPLHNASANGTSIKGLGSGWGMGKLPDLELGLWTERKEQCELDCEG